MPGRSSPAPPEPRRRSRRRGRSAGSGSARRRPNPLNSRPSSPSEPLKPVDAAVATSGSATVRQDAAAVAWWVLVGAASGAIAGALVGGIGGRLAMLLLRLTSPDAVTGMISDDGFEIGVVSFD